MRVPQVGANGCQWDHRSTGLVKHMEIILLINVWLVYFHCSDSTEETPADNIISVSIPVQYNSEIILSRSDNTPLLQHSNISFIKHQNAWFWLVSHCILQST